MRNTRCQLASTILFATVSFCEAISITVEWEPAQTTIAGVPLGATHYYKLFYSTTSGSYSSYIVVTDGSSARLTNLEYNKTMYFRVKTCTDLFESDFSEELFWRAPVMPDADFDGLSDDWERLHFGSLSRAGSNTDYDGNGTADLIEFVAGTDPVNPGDHPSLKIFADGEVRFFARQATGSGYENRTRRYRLLYSDTLAADEWVPVSDMDNITARNQTVSCDLSASGTTGYYRTEIYLD